MRKFIVKKRSSVFFVFQTIFWLVASLTAILVIVFNILNRINHEKKWSDYDDCGVF